MVTELNCTTLVLQSSVVETDDPKLISVPFVSEMIDREFRYLENFDLDLNHPLFFENFN